MDMVFVAKQIIDMHFSLPETVRLNVFTSRVLSDKFCRNSTQTNLRGKKKTTTDVRDELKNQNSFQRS